VIGSYVYSSRDKWAAARQFGFGAVNAEHGSPSFGRELIVLGRQSKISTNLGMGKRVAGWGPSP
jgi:hypothetical protein